MQDAVAMHSSSKKQEVQQPLHSWRPSPPHGAPLTSSARAWGLTSSAGVLMSMGSMTVNSFFTFFTVAQGRCSLAFTQ